MPFRYTEIIPDRYLKFVPDNLNLNKTKNREAFLIRLLLGTLDYSLLHDPIKVEQRIDYSNTFNTSNTIISAKIIRNFLRPLSIEDLDQYLSRFKGVNQTFINDLLFEFSLFFLNQKKGNHLSAFVQAYRILEFTSYSFPLIHSSLFKNFQGTFTDLQSYFTKEGGELGFLVKFINKLFDGDPILSSTIDINIIGPTGTIQDKIYKGYKKVLANHASFDDSFHKVTIEYTKLIEVVRVIRNRYFHFAIGGQKNIKNSDIEYPDLFFLQINNHIINWLSIIYFEILKNLVANWKA